MKISVALCTYNGGPYLAAQLASLAAQDRPPDELVVCDDRSTDDTLDTLTRFAASVRFPVRITVNDINVRSTKNFERAISLCSGDVIFLCDQDDLWKPTKLGRFEAAFADAGVALVASDLEIVDASGNPHGRRVWPSLPFTPRQQDEVEHGGGPRLWIRYNTVTGAASAFRADLREIVLPIPACWVHDAWIAFLAAAVGDVHLVREPLTFYRSHSSQQIGCAPMPLSRQIQAARQMDAAYFQRVAECFDALAERLEMFRHRLRDPGLVSFVQAKAEFARVQMRMREGGRIWRVWPAMRELVCGRYHRFGRGLKGFAADLLL